MQNYNEKLKIDIRKRSYAHALKTIQFIESLKHDKTCNIIGSQLLRSATSIGANIVEAQASPTKKDFTNFLNHSLKSANETKFWLGLLRDSGKVSPEIIDPLFQETTEISNILASSILTIRGKRKL